ncbi:MAG: ABC transporter substrate-binding protein [Spirochaetales bacterium]|nr:ABC transporter substrate-binding protein [Spirochaetales bacterium]
MKSKKFLVLVIVFLLMTLSIWAEGTTEKTAEKTKVNFQLNWKITGDHAAYYVALEKGWFAEEGLDVNIIIGHGSGYTVKALDSGKAEMGIADAPVAIVGRAKGAKVEIVGIIFDKHPNCMFFWKDSGITKPQDIAGKTVAVPASDGHKVMWPAFAKLIAVDPNSVHFINIEPSAKVSALASKRADVVFELYTGKPFMEKAIPPDKLGHFIWSDYGFNAYAHSIIATDDMVNNHPKVVKAFLKAAYRGWDFTLKNPKEAIAILAKYHPINQTDYLNNLKLVMEFFKTGRYKKYGIGYIDPKRIQETMDLVKNYMHVDIKFKPEDMYTSKFLPDPMYKYNW